MLGLIVGMSALNAIGSMIREGQSLQVNTASAPTGATDTPAQDGLTATVEALPITVFAYPVEACKAVIALMNDRDPSTFDGHKLPEGLAHVTWRSPDDGKRWQARCEMIGNDRLQWAAFDAFGDGQQGRWRSEDTIEVTVENGHLHIDLNQSGVIRKQKSYPLSALS
jgi:hypothetical protein